MSSETIHALYDAFARLDGAAMAECYADDAVFEDPVFDLRGHAQIGGMWRMLCDAASRHGETLFRIETSGVRTHGVDGTRGEAHWEAWYRFSATGRDVHNVIDATFTFDADHRILTHRDQFDFWRWSRQALGLPGVMLGWSPWMKRRVRERARTNLERYMALGAR